MRYIILFHTIVIVLLAVALIRSRKVKSESKEAPAAKATVTQEPKQTATQAQPDVTEATFVADVTETEQKETVSGVARAVGEASHAKEGSAIRAFTANFLNRVYDLSDDWQVTIRRGSEVQYFQNPSLDLLGKFNTAGWSVSCQLDELDMASAVVLVISQEAYEQQHLPVYPTLTIDLGVKDELLLVFRLTEVIDRQTAPDKFRARGILEEVMLEKIRGAELRDYRSLPLAGFFLRGSKDAVRLVRYGRAHDFDVLVNAFGAGKKIQDVLASAHAQVDANGELPRTEEEQVFDDIFVSLTSTAPLTVYKLPLLAKVFGLKLMDAGFDEEIRLKFATEFLSRVQILEPVWYKSEGVSEQDIVTIFRDPTVDVTPAPTTTTVS